MHFLCLGLNKLLPVVGYAVQTGNVWKLDSGTLRYPIRGNLPYDKVCLYFVIYCIFVYRNWSALHLFTSPAEILFSTTHCKRIGCAIKSMINVFVILELT